MFTDMTNGPLALAAMKEGRYAEAGKYFELSATNAYAAGDFLSVKMSALLAVKAYAKGADGANAVRFCLATIDAFVAAKHPPVEVKSFAKKALEELRLYEQNAAADEVSAQMGKRIGGEWHDPAAPRLPAFCPSCGAPVKPAEVVRPTPSTVACKFCGASLGA